MGIGRRGLLIGLGLSVGVILGVPEARACPQGLVCPKGVNCTSASQCVAPPTMPGTGAGQAGLTANPKPATGGSTTDERTLEERRRKVAEWLKSWRRAAEEQRIGREDAVRAGRDVDEAKRKADEAGRRSDDAKRAYSLALKRLHAIEEGTGHFKWAWEERGRRIPEAERRHGPGSREAEELRRGRETLGRQLDRNEGYYQRAKDDLQRRDTEAQNAAIELSRALNNYFETLALQNTLLRLFQSDTANAATNTPAPRPPVQP